MAIKRDENKEARKFGLVLGIGLIALAGWLWYRHKETSPEVCLAVGGTSLFLAFVLPSVWLRIFRLWMKFAEALSWVMTRVILSVFFYLLMTPIGLIMRILGKDLLDLKYKDGRSTYWVDKPKGEYTLERYRKQY